jgi:phosphate starvation-inducible PhoH-like protein
VCVRAAVESADSKLGFLPGDLGSKYDVYMMPFYDKFEELLTVDQIKRLKGDNRIINQPINFCRGLSFTARIILVDEMQNGTMNEIVTLLTRIGKFSKMIICADPSQSDLPFNKQGGFEKLIKIFDNNAAKEHGIHFFEYGEEDIVRSDLCRFIVEEITKYKKSEEALKANTITSKSENKFINGSANVIANAGSGTGAYTGAGIIVNHTGIVNNDCYHKEQSYSETWTPSRDE